MLAIEAPGWRDETRRDETRRDETRRDETRRDETRRDETRARTAGMELGTTSQPGWTGREGNRLPVRGPKGLRRNHDGEIPIWIRCGHSAGTMFRDGRSSVGDHLRCHPRR